MVRAGRFSKPSLPLIAALWFWGAANGGTNPEVPAARDVEIQVVVVRAKGRAEKPKYDPAVPKELQRQIEANNLAYGEYQFVGVQRKGASFGKDTSFTLPENESLVIRASGQDERPNLVGISCRILDSHEALILGNQLKVPYNRMFLIQRVRAPGAIIMGVSAHKPPAAPPKP